MSVIKPMIWFDKQSLERPGYPIPLDVEDTAAVHDGEREINVSRAINPEDPRYT